MKSDSTQVRLDSILLILAAAALSVVIILGGIGLAAFGGMQELVDSVQVNSMLLVESARQIERGPLTMQALQAELPSAQVVISGVRPGTGCAQACASLSPVPMLPPATSWMGATSQQAQPAALTCVCEEDNKTSDVMIQEPFFH
jgi:hypothetical protein